MIVHNRILGDYCLELDYKTENVGQFLSFWTKILLYDNKKK